MSRILSPYGVKPIELKKHLNNIGFDPQKITIENIDYTLFLTNGDNNSEYIFRIYGNGCEYCLSFTKKIK